MNTQLNIKTRRWLFSPNVVTLLIGIVVVLVLGGPSTQAQTTSTDTTTTPAGTVDSSITLVAKGSLTDSTGSVTITGNVPVTGRQVIDTTNAATVTLMLLDLDFSQVQGTSGKKVFVTGGNHATQIRPFQATDKVIVTVPYYDSTKDGLSAKTMLATVTLNFDITTGKLTSGSITIGNNVVTADAVGTTTAIQ
jgi:hypothetical protein